MPVFKYMMRHLQGNFTRSVVAKDVYEASMKLAKSLNIDESTLSGTIEWIEKDGKRIFQG